MWFLFSCALFQNSNHKGDSAPSPQLEQNIKSILEIPQIPNKGLEFSSIYSNILVQDKGSVRSLYFVRDSGQIVLETSVDLKQPHILQVPYTEAMFVSEAFFPSGIRSSLLIGLGGGAMVHHIHHHWPKQKLDAVEIDPVIVDIAKNYFIVPHKEPNIQLHVEDGFVFIQQALKEERKYDVIYMDAFLKPSTDTDSTGVPLRLKTLAFYDELKAILNQDGIVVFNINNHKDINTDLGHIEESFEQTWKMAVPNRGNIIVVACTKAIDQTTLYNQATHSQEKKGLGIEEWVKRLKVWSIKD
jgi:spermidine synthase